MSFIKRAFRNPVRIVRLLCMVLVLLALSLSILGYVNQYARTLFEGKTVDIYQDVPFLRDLYAVIAPELASIALIILILDTLNGWRQKEQLKQQLKRDLLCGVRDFAVKAVGELRTLGWLDEVLLAVKDNLYGVELAGARLHGANLSGAQLWHANLHGARLHEADLKGAELHEANLEDAELYEANLEGAWLITTNLKGSKLYKANLEGAKLYKANLAGAGLQEANLKGADLELADLEGAHLHETNLEGANLQGAFLGRANLSRANLGEANLDRTNLERAWGWSAEQLRQTKSAAAAIMPDGTKLRGLNDPIGPTLEEWIQRQDSQISDEQADSLKVKVNALESQTGTHRLIYYSKMQRQFGVKSYRELTVRQYEAALEFLSGMERADGDAI